MKTQAELRTKLRAALARIVNVQENEITNAFSLDIQKFHSSAGSVILSNVVKKIYKQKVDCSGVKTLGELMARIEGKDEALISKSEGAPEVLPEAKPGAAVPKQHVLSQDTPERLPQYQAIPESIPGAFTCGIDIQDVSIFPEAQDYWSEPFYRDNFTDEEIAHCATASFPRQHFAARWCIKESLKKNASVFLSLPFKYIQVKKRDDGSIFVECFFKEKWQPVAGTCSMSHSEQFAVGMVMVVGYER
jgi:phosphopantetheine--protein transferase-like protein